MLQTSAIPQTEQSVLNRWVMPAARFLFWTVVFGLAHTQAPLYYSNQNQYFLHGLADGGLGFLDRDWLANTLDPTPLFSGLVAFTYRHLHPTLFHVCYFLILGVYLHSLAGIFAALTGARPGSLARLCFLAAMTLLHSGLLRLVSTRLFGVDYPWFLQSGVAGQYVLGPGLQPSTFGVLLLASLWAFLCGRPFVAVTLSSLAAVLHGTYLLGAALLTLAYLTVCWRDGRARSAVLLGAWGLLLVLPAVVYNLITFAPTSAEQFAKAQHILAEFRIPHHAVPARWLDRVAIAQTVWIALALVLARGTRLFPIVLIVFSLSLLLTLLQMATANPSLGLLFPWRTSAILVPVATTVVLTNLLGPLAPWLDRLTAAPRRALQLACGAVLAVAVVGGVVIGARGLAYHSNPDELAVLEYVRTHKSEGDVYLLPVAIPKMVTETTGVISTSFTPAPTRRQADHLIAVDLQRFRLDTGAPIVVDFKSIPYKDVEVLEWRDRLDEVQKLYDEDDWDRAEVRTVLTRYGVTHVVAPAGLDLHGESLKQVHADMHYRVYRVSRAPQARLVPK